MTTRYFEIRAPRRDFTGRVGPISFADGVSRVQFDDTRDEDGVVVSDEHHVSPGRAMVMFAKRRLGYTVTELGADGKPLPAVDDEDDEKPAIPGRSASKVDWKAYAVTLGMTDEAAEALTRDQLAERFLGPKEGGSQ